MSAPAHECLDDALVAAKMEFSQVVKGRRATIKSNKGDFGYRYANLEDVIDAVEGALTKHGIAQIQRMAVRDGLQLLVSELRRKGEVIDSEMVLPLEGLPPQDCGKVISFYRRYALLALLGITAEDDDAADTGHVRQPPVREHGIADQRDGEIAGSRNHGPPAEADRGQRTYVLNGKRYRADDWIVEADEVARSLPPGRLSGFLESTKGTRNEIYKFEAGARDRLMALSEDLKARALGAVAGGAA